MGSRSHWTLTCHSLWVVRDAKNNLKNKLWEYQSFLYPEHPKLFANFGKELLDDDNDSCVVGQELEP